MCLQSALCCSSEFWDAEAPFSVEYVLTLLILFLLAPFAICFMSHACVCMCVCVSWLCQIAERRDWGREEWAEEQPEERLDAGSGCSHWLIHCWGEEKQELQVFFFAPTNWSTESMDNLIWLQLNITGKTDNHVLWTTETLLTLNVL